MLYNAIMAYASLYRKYRPSSFDEVIGQNSVVRTLRNMVKAGSIAHAYLFTGTRGTGKTSVARIFAKAVNCTNPQDGSPCCQCAACKAFDNGANVDFIELDAASNNSVDDIRELREAVKYPPANSDLRYKVYIIDEVHQLTSAAFNAFLKTLEEPPAYCLFILATTEVQKLPQTILSRCLRFDFALVGQETLADHVGHIYDKEGVQYSREALETIARAGQGSVRDTLSVADTCLTASDGMVTYDKVLEVLGANDPSIIANLVADILQGNMAGALGKVEDSASKGKSIVILTRDVTQYLRDLLIIQSDVNANGYLHMPEKSYRRAQEIANSADRAVLVRTLGIFTGLDTSMRYAATPRTILENAIAKSTVVTGNEGLDLAAKVANLEKQIAKCQSEIANGVRVADINLPPVVGDAEEAPVLEQEAQVQTQDDLFAEAEAPIASLPTDSMSNTAVAIQYRTALSAELAKRKYLMLSTMVTSSFITIDGYKVFFSFNEENDKNYFAQKEDVIRDASSNLLPFKPEFQFAFKPRKQNVDDDFANLVSIVGKSKITKK